MPLLGFLFALIPFLGVAVWLIDRQLVSDPTNWQLRFTSVFVSSASAWVMFGVWYFGYLESGGPWWMQVGEWLLIVFWLSKADHLNSALRFYARSSRSAMRRSTAGLKPTAHAISALCPT